MCVKEKTSRCSAMWDCLVSFECVCMRVRVYLCLVKYACETKRVGVVPTDCLVSFQRVCVCVCERERESLFLYACMHVCVGRRDWVQYYMALSRWIRLCIHVFLYMSIFAHIRTLWFDYCYIMEVWLCLLLYYCGFMSIGHYCYSVAFYLLMHPKYFYKE